MTPSLAHLRDNWDRFGHKDSNPPRFVAVHLDHGLRVESQEDARFCKENASRLGLGFISGKVNVTDYHRKSRGGVEADSRRARCAFFLECIRQIIEIPEIRFENANDESDEVDVLFRGIIAEKNGLPPVAVNKDKVFRCIVYLGHTLDDQAESALMNIARGSGLRGAGAMKELDMLAYGHSPAQEVYFGPEQKQRLALSGESVSVPVQTGRPLLGIRRKRLVDLLSEGSISYLSDPTNLDRAYSPRNRIRLDVIPNLEKAFPKAVEGIGKFSGIAASAQWEAGQVAASYAREQFKEFAYVFPGFFIPGEPLINGRLLPLNPFCSFPLPVQAEIVRSLSLSGKIRITKKVIDAILSLANAPSGKIGPYGMEAAGDHGRRAQ